MRATSWFVGAGGGAWRLIGAGGAGRRRAVARATAQGEVGHGAGVEYCCSAALGHGADGDA